MESKKTKRLVNEIKSSKQEYQDFSITQKKCPECGANLREKNTRDGKIYVCTNSDCNYRRRKDPKVSNHRCPQCHRKMEIIEGKTVLISVVNTMERQKNCLIKKSRRRKMTKHEERRLLKKYAQAEKNQKKPLAAALKAAMKK